MFKTIIAAAIATVAVFAVAAPAQAHDHTYVYPTWHYSHTYHQEHDYSYRVYHSYEHETSCEWVWQKVSVWTDEGPVWVSKKIQVCH